MAVQYVWCARYIDAPVLRDEDTDADGDCTDSDDEHLYTTQDANFNTTALVDASDGSVVERYACDPYGAVTIWNEARTSTIAWANSKQNEVLFCGYRFDEESGLYHVRHRMYHPTLGRWLQRDPLGYVDGMGLYAYCAGGPAGATDAMGLTEMMTLLYKPDEMSMETRTLEWRAEWEDPSIVLLGDDADNNPRPKTEKKCPEVPVTGTLSVHKLAGHCRRDAYRFRSSAAAAKALGRWTGRACGSVSEFQRQRMLDAMYVAVLECDLYTRLAEDFALAMARCSHEMNYLMDHGAMALADTPPNVVPNEVYIPPNPYTGELRIPTGPLRLGSKFVRGVFEEDADYRLDEIQAGEARRQRMWDEPWPEPPPHWGSGLE